MTRTLLIRATCLVTTMYLSTALAQDGPADNYAVLSANELVDVAAQLKDRGNLTGQVRDSIAKRAVILITENSQQFTDGATLAKLAKLGESAIPLLSNEERQALENALAAADSPSAHFDWVHFEVALMQESGASRAEINERVAEWIEDVGIEKLTVEKARWCLEQSLPQDASRNEFFVIWTGNIAAPVSGEYVFSVANANSNKSGPLGEVVRHSISVMIDGRQVVNATPESWDWQGERIQLEAGTSTSIEVAMSYYAITPTYGDSPHALLYWQGPGIDRSIMPPSAFASAGQEGGLQAVYRWFENGGLQESVRREPNIEFAWAGVRNVAPRRPELIVQLKNQLFELATNPTYLDQLVGPAEKRPAHKHVYFRNYFSTEYLTCAQRRAFLALLDQNPQLLEQADSTEILRLYQSLRFGDESRAVEMLGTWLQSTDAEPTFSADFFDSNRRFYRTIALYLKWRGGDLVEEFEEKFLVTPEDECCLPAAYSLSYCYLMSGAMEEWAEKLDDKLADESLSVKQRAGWLLARAQAAELESCDSDRFVECKGNLLRGRKWLDDATLIAEDPQVRLRAEKEVLTRTASTGSLKYTLTRIEELVGEYTQPTMQTQMTEWREQVMQLAQNREREKEQAAQLAKQSYRAELERRRTEAAAAGDTATAANYEAILGSVDVSPEQ
jgi:hypothetical protein